MSRLRLSLRCNLRLVLKLSKISWAGVVKFCHWISSDEEKLKNVIDEQNLWKLWVFLFSCLQTSCAMWIKALDNLSNFFASDHWWNSCGQKKTVLQQGKPNENPFRCKQTSYFTRCLIAWAGETNRSQAKSNHTFLSSLLLVNWEWGQNTRFLRHGNNNLCAVKAKRKIQTSIRANLWIQLLLFTLRNKHFLFPINFAFPIHSMQTNSNCLCDVKCTLAGFQFTGGSCLIWKQCRAKILQFRWILN